VGTSQLQSSILIKGERLEGGPMRSAGAIFTTKVKAWASENGKPDFWKKSA
jgi:hypothetical protein